MRVGIDGGCWSNRRGFGRFFREILDALARVDALHQYTVFLDPASYSTFHLSDRFQPVLVNASEPVSEALAAAGGRSVSDLLRMGRAAAREPLDLFFFPSVHSFFPIFTRIPVVLGIHDTIPERNPSFAFDSRWQRTRWRWKARVAIAQADAIFTVSEYSKRSLAEFYGIPPHRIRVLYEAASSRFRKLDTPPPAERYILYAGGISPNKNLSTLIRAFEKMRARGSGLKLILAGDYESDSFKGCYAELKELVSRLGLGREVVFAGFVPDEDLCALYNEAALFVFPSFDEGFGLPPLEAMACGCPVVASAGHALEEVVADAGVLVDPHDASALSAAMDRILADPDLARELAEKSLRRASRFSWDRTALELLRLFEETKSSRS